MGRETYVKLSLEELEENIKENLTAFIRNMKRLKFPPTDFPDWFETFGAWLDVGTKEEHFVYGHSQLPPNYNKPIPDTSQSGSK